MIVTALRNINVKNEDLTPIDTAGESGPVTV
jgi:hypothetical protein